MRRVSMAMAVVGLLAVHAAPALAATARLEPRCHRTACDVRHLWVTAAPGEQNDIRVTVTSEGALVTDSRPVTPGSQCVPRPDGSALCRLAEIGLLSGVHVDLGDMDDSAGGDFTFGKVYLSGGAGDDLLVASDTRTIFTGGPGDDRMIGGAAVDLFLEGRTTSGSDRISGGGDTLWENPPLLVGDAVSYADRVRPVRAGTGGQPDDGQRGEHDTIGADVEALLGGHAGDTLTGDESADYLNGGHGDDVLRGLGGADLLYGSRGGDRIFDGRWFDRVRAGPGRDRIRSGPGPDDIVAGPGNDVIWTRGGPEPVDCGAGFDRVFASPLDQLTEDCERRVRPR
jgi:hypothetical protein